MPWYFYFACKQLFPSGKPFSFFAVLSIVGVALGVGLLLIVQTVMNGFGHEIRSKMVASSGDIIVTSRGILYQVEETMAALAEHEEILAVTPYADGAVMLQHANIPTYPLVRGIPVQEDNPVINMEDFVFRGSWHDLDEDGIVLSTGLARSLNASLGSLVNVTSPALIESLKKDEILLPYELEVVGIFEVGWQEVDANMAVVSLDLMQDLYQLRDGLHGVMAKIADPEQAPRIAAELNERLPVGVLAQSWLDLNRDLLFILQLEKSVMFFIMIFVVIVSCFSITIALMMSVIRKTREVGMLAAMGATSRQIAAIFGLQGLLIGVVGTAIGLGGGWLILTYRNEIVSGFARITSSETALLRYYQFANLPIKYESTDVLMIAVLSVSFSCLAGMVPAWRAARMKPVEALRSE